MLAVRPAGTFNRGPSGSTIQSRQSDDYLGRRQVLHRATWALDSATCEVPALTRRLVRPLAVTQRHEREVQAGGELVPTQPRLNRRSHQTTGSAGGCPVNLRRSGLIGVRMPATVPLRYRGPREVNPLRGSAKDQGVRLPCPDRDSHPSEVGRRAGPETLSHKPQRGEFSCAPMTTTRFPVESNRLGDALDDREMGLHGVGQIGDCDPIQWPGVYATASRQSGCLDGNGAGGSLQPAAIDRPAEAAAKTVTPTQPLQEAQASQRRRGTTPAAHASRAGTPRPPGDAH